MKIEYLWYSVDLILLGLVTEIPIGVIAVSHEKIGHPTVVFFENPLGAE